jgi:hypothetical protein
MINKGYQRSILILLFIFSPLAFAVPPYIGVSVGQSLSFDSASCLTAAKAVLNKDGFQKVVQYKTSITLFAAYKNRNPYHYKAMIKCLAQEGVIIAVAVAKVPKHAKAKAESLLQQIQRHKWIAKQAVVEEEVIFTEEESDVVSNRPKAQHRLQAAVIAKTVSERSRETLLSRSVCLSRAEQSLRDSGFYRGLSFDDDTIWAKNEKQYQGKIRCLTGNSLVLFQVKGGYKATREKGLNQLEKNF